MTFDIITIFPNIIEEYINTGILKNALQDGVININVHNLRKWAEDKHKTVDDTPYGGGPGMVMKIEPIYKAIEELKNDDTVVCITSPKGDRLTQSKFREFSKDGGAHYIIICGRYEGVDQRVHDHLVDYEFSAGDYILTGGELPALVFIDGISRLLPGVLGNEKSLEIESFNSENIVDYPQYTKPENFKDWRVPDILLSGHHKRIEEWRNSQQY